MGSHLYFTDIPQEVALRGVDTEAVGLLLDQGTWQLRGGAGVYGFWHPNTGVAAIGRGRGGAPLGRPALDQRLGAA